MKAANDDVQMRSDWLFPICTGGERLKNEKGDKLHPTQKPEALLARVMLSSTKPGDVVLDPFFGSGTTGAVAKRLGRHFVGVEREQDYIDAAQERIDAVDADGPAPTCRRCCGKRAEPRVAFVSLIDAGIVQPGTMLHDSTQALTAQVRADGTLSIGDARRLDPQDGRAGAGAGRLQRLDLLALRAQWRPDPDRRAAPHRPARHGAGRGVSGAVCLINIRWKRSGQIPAAWRERPRPSPAQP